MRGNFLRPAADTRPRLSLTVALSLLYKAPPAILALLLARWLSCSTTLLVVSWNSAPPELLYNPLPVINTCEGECNIVAATLNEPILLTAMRLTNQLWHKIRLHVTAIQFGCTAGHASDSVKKEKCAGSNRLADISQVPQVPLALVMQPLLWARSP